MPTAMIWGGTAEGGGGPAEGSAGPAARGRNRAGGPKPPDRHGRNPGVRCRRPARLRSRWENFRDCRPRSPRPRHRRAGAGGRGFRRTLPGTRPVAGPLARHPPARTPLRRGAGRQTPAAGASPERGDSSSTVSDNIAPGADSKSRTISRHPEEGEPGIGRSETVRSREGDSRERENGTREEAALRPSGRSSAGSPPSKRSRTTARPPAVQGQGDRSQAVTGFRGEPASGPEREPVRTRSRETGVLDL